MPQPAFELGYNDSLVAGWGVLFRDLHQLSVPNNAVHGNHVAV
jgi:hypothetical protein